MVPTTVTRSLRITHLSLFRIVVVAGLLATLAATQADQTLPGRVLRVVDGDRLIIDVRGSQHLVSLAGIDAPEQNQPWGAAAAQHLNTTMTGLFVVVEVWDTNRDREVTGRVALKGRDVALDLLHDGLAWSTIGLNGPHDDRHPYVQAEHQARAARRGLWSDDQRVPPWQWREQRGGQENRPEAGLLQPR